jgi:GT2 family glycosyltransferase
VVVVDNGSSDATVARVRERPAVRLLDLGENTGFAHGVDVGVAASDARFVALLNPDCVVEPGCFAALRDRLRADAGIGVAAALLRYPDGTVQHFARRRLGLAALWWDLTWTGREIDRRRRQGRGRARRRCEDVDLARGAVVDEAAAACVLVERARMPSPLMDERFPLYYNDADLYAELRARGLRVEVVPDAVALHGYGTSVRRLDLAKNRAEFVAATRRFTRKRWPLRRALAADALLLADVLVAALAYFGRREDFLLRAHIQGTLGAFGLPGGVRPPLSR